MSTDNYKTKRVRFVDNGLFGGFARRVAPFFGKADYFCPWQHVFPTYKRTKLWQGFPEFDVVRDPLDDADEIDLWVFLDVYHAPLQHHLVQLGARVWGARSGEELELHRWKFKQLLKRLGLPVGESELIRGTTALRNFLLDKKDWFVKADSGYERGDMETWKWKGKHISTGTLDEKEYDLGADKEDFNFVVEAEIARAVEIGYDGYTIDGLFPTPSMQGLEIKGLGLLGVVKPYDRLTPAVRVVNSALSNELALHEYRGFYAMEMRKTAATLPFPLDPCCRFGSPSNEVLQCVFKGWPKILWEGAEGVLVNPETVAKYGLVAMVYSESSGKNSQPLRYPREMDEWILLRNGFRRGNDNYSLPQGAPGNIAGVVGTGNTILEAVANCAHHARQLDGQMIEISLDAAGKALEQIAVGEKYGVKFTEDKLPTEKELKAAIS
jgi:hypothetical protein